MSNDIDLYLGNRLRRRRRLMGLTQQQVAQAIGIHFQQIQKYECGANRISASRLWELASALEVPISYFYNGLENKKVAMPIEDIEKEHGHDPVMGRKETQDLIQAYYQLDEHPRRKLLDLAKSLHDGVS